MLIKGNYLYLKVKRNASFYFFIHHKDILEHPWLQDPEEKTVGGGEMSRDHLVNSDDQGSQGDTTDKGGLGDPGKPEDGFKHQEKGAGGFCQCSSPKNVLQGSSDCCKFDPELLLQPLQEDFV